MAMTEELVRLGKALADRQLVAGAAGNISIRDETGTIYITARGARLDAIAAEDMREVLTGCYLEIAGGDVAMVALRFDDAPAAPAEKGGARR